MRITRLYTEQNEAILLSRIIELAREQGFKLSAFTYNEAMGQVQIALEKVKEE